MTLADLADEFASAAAAAEAEHFDALVARGVPRSWLWRGPMRFGVEEIAGGDDGLYQPMPGGELAVIVPALPLAAPWEDDFPVEDLGDLVAWLPRDSSRWWRRCGLMPILNPAALERAAWFREPLSVWSTPLRWLRASGNGIVLLDGTANLRLWLGDVDTIHADTYELGDDIDHRLRLPRVPRPEILVPRAA